MHGREACVVGGNMCGREPLQRAVRILLECIRVHIKIYVLLLQIQVG